MNRKKRKLSILRFRQIRNMLHSNGKAVSQKMEALSYGDIINIIIAILTFLSVIGVFWTILEMRRDRDAAYRPAIVMNPIELHFLWDSNNESDNSNLQAILSHSQNRYEFSAVNIGVGTAKNVVFEWDKNNTVSLFRFLLAHDSSKSDFCTIGEDSDTFLINNHVLMMNKENPTLLMYMLPEAEEKYSLIFPTQYLILIEEITKARDFDNSSPPYLILYVNYEDIQGKAMKSSYFITIKKLLYSEGIDGTGEAIYQLVPQVIY